MGVVSISGTNVTVFGDQAGAKTYWQVAIGGSTFLDADSNVQKQSLVSVTRWLQSVGLVDCDTGLEVLPTADDTGVPEDVVNGTYELALAVIADPKILTQSASGASNIKAAGAGSARVEFFRPQDGTRFPEAALRLLRKYVAAASGNAELFGSAPGSSSTGSGSSFADKRYPGLNEGFA